MEYKFKAWNTTKKIMHSPEEMGRDQLALSPDGKGFINVSGISTKLSIYCKHLIPLQYTNIKDKNGTEIYGECDIYKDTDGVVSVVKMAVDGWALFPIKKGSPLRNLYWHNVCDVTSGEVISNIYEHPKLLEVING